MYAPQAALAAPIGVRAELDFPGMVPSFPFPDWESPAERELPDRLAWRNDHESKDDENYPGASWDDPDRFEPTPDDVAALHESAPGDHDGQLDPNDVAYWTISDREYWDHEFAAWAERDEFERAWHNAEVEPMARFLLVPFVGRNHP